MAKLIISYRRSDSAAIAGRIRDRLVAHYGVQSVFMDIENIPFGTDFREHIRTELLQSDVLIVVVGPEWIGRHGSVVRIHQETDPVRIEVETALRGGIPIIPLLVERARMPEPTDLPDSLQSFAFLNAAEVDTGRDFHTHMERLIQALDKIVAARSGASDAPARAAAPAPVSPTPAAAKGRRVDPLVAAAVALVLIAAGGGWWFLTGTRSASTSVVRQSQPVQQAAAPAPTAQQASPTAPPQEPAQFNAVVRGVVQASQGRPPEAATSLPASCASATAPLFADDFKSVDNGWKHLGKTRIGSEAGYQNGEMILRAATDNTKWIQYPAVVVRNATVCAELRSPREAEGTQNTAGGIVFWADADNIDNVYTAHIYPDGSYAILRKHAKTWSVIARKSDVANIRRGADAINVVQVDLKDNNGTLFINGEAVEHFRGQPPANGGTVGLFARAPAGSQPTWRFVKVSVVKNAE